MEKHFITRHDQLDVFKLSFETAMMIFEISKKFPREERYSLTDQIRRSSRSVCANISEGWRKRRYKGAFIGRLSDSESEAAETQTWLLFALYCNYMREPEFKELHDRYDNIIGKIVRMIRNPDPWLL